LVGVYSYFFLKKKEKTKLTLTVASRPSQWVVGQPVYEAEGGRTTVGTLLGGPLRHSRGRATTPETFATPSAPQGWPTTHHTLVFNFFSFFFF
jgi:hypothetical protein